MVTKEQKTLEETQKYQGYNTTGVKNTSCFYLKKSFQNFFSLIFYDKFNLVRYTVKTICKLNPYFDKIQYWNYSKNLELVLLGHTLH